MKAVASIVIVFAMFSPLRAELVLSEDFEGAGPGTAVNGYNGWSGDDGILISDNTIDQGQSAEAGVKVGDNWAVEVYKSFSYDLGSDQRYVLSATLYAPAPSNEYAQLSVIKEPGSDEDAVLLMLGYGDLICSYENAGMANYQELRVSYPGEIWDVKAEIAEGQTDFYYRAHGEPDWVSIGSIDAGVPSLYQYVNVKGHNGYFGGIDTVVLEAADDAIPGDLNDDGLVGSADLDIVRGNWGATVPAGDLLSGDPSADGIVGSADLDIVRANWGAGAAASAVPEPNACVLLLVSGIAGLLVRRGTR